MPDKYISRDSASFFAFNVWDLESARAVLDAAAEGQGHVILQTSASVFKKLDKAAFRGFVKAYAEEKRLNAYIHLDHCRDISLIRLAVDAKWDSVMIDASHLSLDANIRMTRETIAIAHGAGVLVEAELGQIMGVEEDIAASKEGVASLEDVRQFLAEAQVDMLAVAIGTAHGLYKGVPVLDYELIGEVGRISDVPFVVHGGTGLGDDVFCKLLSFENVKKINISTDVKLAYRQGLVQSQNMGWFDEYRFDAMRISECIHDSIRNMCLHKLSLLPDVKESSRGAFI